MTIQKEIREWITKNLSQWMGDPEESTSEILSYLHSQGVVLKVERELPEFYTSKMPTAVGMFKRDKGIECGFFESLIKEEK